MQLEEKPEIRPFLQNTLNPSELENLAEQFTTGWTVRYQTIQVAVSKEKHEPFKTGWLVRYNTVQTAVSRN